MEENYLENIRGFIISEQARTIVRDYNANKSKLETNYNIGKELSEAGKHYGEGIIKKYAFVLTKEFGKGFQYKELYKMLQFYNLCGKVGAVHRQLTWNHYLKLLPLKDINEINYYINIVIRDNLSYRKLAERIKRDEYGRLPLETKIKLKESKEVNEKDMVPSTIFVPSNKLKEELTEKVLENLIIDNISYVMKQLGEGYCFIDNQYKINIGNNKNYIDILLFNYKFNNFVVIEIKARKFRKEDVGQILLYMNYIDKEVKTITQNSTMGIIITKEVNEFVVRYVNHDKIAISSIDLIREEVKE
ncbi:PDDEXK nuclease domain-containing protein [uncultured Clostridium sp.]|uniref:PDDEXK nuclease domain-containing protein n=1 Tax=uncultured Clostridium sp. TaxID=59620 RepID=UPI0025E2DDCC|nr:PDDEXK nuclease domain-containing protein [uncultured Clostridium sp.]